MRLNVISKCVFVFSNCVSDFRSLLRAFRVFEVRAVKDVLLHHFLQNLLGLSSHLAQMLGYFSFFALFHIVISDEIIDNLFKPHVFLRCYFVLDWI